MANDYSHNVFLSDVSAPVGTFSYITANNLLSSLPLKTNSSNIIYSTLLNIADTSGLQTALNSTLTNPYVGTLKASDFESDDYFSHDTELQKIDNLTASTANNTNITGYLNATDIQTTSVFDATRSTFIELDATDINVSATNFTFNGIPVSSSQSSSTGQLTGGIISINVDPTKFDITSGTGTVTLTGGVQTNVSWTAFTAQSTTYTGVLTYVSINSSAAIVYSTLKPTPTQMRDNIFLGVLIHSDGVNLNTINNEQATIAWEGNSTQDLYHAVGFLNTSGNVLSASGILLRFQKSAGTMFGYGLNYSNNEKDPHTLTLTLIDTNASGVFGYRAANETSSAVNLVDIRPNILDDLGNYSTFPAVQNNYWTVQRVWAFSSQAIRIQAGQYEYFSSAEAIAGIESETFVIEPSIIENGMLIGYIVVQEGTTNLNNALFLTSGKFQTIGGGGIGVPIASDILALNAGGASYTTVQDLQNIFHSSGYTSGGLITDAGGGAVNVTGGEGFLRDADSSLADCYFIAWPASFGGVLVDMTLNYIIVSWNSGSPTIGLTSTSPNGYDNFILGTAYRSGTTLDITPYATTIVADHALLMQKRMKALSYFMREADGGAILTQVGVNKITITEGRFWLALKDFTLPTIDTNTGGDTFIYYYNAGSYTAVPSQTTIDNLQYDNGGVLATLGNSRYGVHWVYKGAGLNNSTYVIYGTGSYTLTEAEDAGSPSSLPAHFSKHAILISKIIIQKSASTFIVESVFTNPISGTSSGINQVNGLGVDNAICRFDTDGNTIQNSGITIDDTDRIIGTTQLNVSSGGLDIGSEVSSSQKLLFAASAGNLTIGVSGLNTLYFSNSGIRWTSQGNSNLNMDSFGHMTLTNSQFRIANNLLRIGETAAQGTSATNGDVYVDSTSKALVYRHNNVAYPLGGINLRSIVTNAGTSALPSYTFSTDLDTGMYLGSVGVLNMTVGGDECLIMSKASSDMAIGRFTTITSGSNGNTAVGTSALNTIISPASSNTGVGAGALSTITIGTQNTACGRASLINNSDGDFNSAFGYNAGNSSASLDNCLALGYLANCTVSNECVIGNISLTHIRPASSSACSLGTSLIPFDDIHTTGALLSANGSESAPTYSFTTGGNSGMYQPTTDEIALTAGGTRSLFISTNSTRNTTLGSGAGADFSGSTDSTYVGYLAGTGNTSGDFNTGVGASCMTETTTSSNSTALGANAGKFLSGANNVCIGYNSGLGVTATSTGSGNIIIGSSAGTAITTGIDNHFFGLNSGNTCTSGSYNICIGDNSDVGATQINAVAVGSGVNNTTNSTISLGNTSMTALHCNNDGGCDLGKSGARFQDVWATNATIQTSDEKEKIIEPTFEYGLDFIKKIKPISYKWVKGGVRQHLGLDATQIGNLISTGKCRDFGGFVRPKKEHRKNRDERGKVISEEPDYQAPSGLRYNEFIAPMIKAIQELSARLELLESK